MTKITKIEFISHIPANVPFTYNDICKSLDKKKLVLTRKAFNSKLYRLMDDGLAKKTADSNDKMNKFIITDSAIRMIKLGCVPTRKKELLSERMEMSSIWKNILFNPII